MPNLLFTQRLYYYMCLHLPNCYVFFCEICEIFENSWKIRRQQTKTATK